MKTNSIYSIFLVIITITLCSCSNHDKFDNYKIIKNFSDMQSKTIEPGGEEENIDVLIKFTSEEAYSSETPIISKKAFNIYYLFESNDLIEDGEVFNYIIYVPDDIRKKYIKGGGKEPDSGNPFWWYMKAYFPDQVIQINWRKIINFLCNKSTLPIAQSKDYIEGY